MMITYVQGDLFASPAHVLVNTVNTVGVMGKGIAKEFKAIYPEMFRLYQQKCESSEFGIGQLMLYRTPNKTILNFPTKKHWRNPSKVEYVDAGLETFARTYAKYAPTSVAFPQLGCGNGELNWEIQVRPLMEHYLGGLPITVYIHVYDGEEAFLEHRDLKRMKKWLRSEPRSLSFGEVWEDLQLHISQPALSHAGWSVSAKRSGSAKEADSIRFAMGQSEVLITIEDLRDVWTRFRSFGLLSPRDLPTSTQVLAAPLFTLLTELEYVDWARFISIGENGDENTSPTRERLESDEARGVRLVPAFANYKGPGQLSFLELAEVA